MQENNFQKIISQWRRLSGEQVESAALISMSGDSHHQTDKKEEDSERAMLVPDGSKVPIAIAEASATAAVVEPAVITSQPEEKQELMEPDKYTEERKEASGDTQNNDKKSDSEYLEHKESIDKSSEGKGENNKGDNVDSVYLRPPPPHKARSNNSTPPAEEEDCGIKCLYYTLQCCDCVLM